MMSLGGVCYSFIIASMASIVTTMDANEMLFNEKMDCVSSYMGKHDFPHILFRRVRRYYKHLYQQRTAVDETEILDGLSARLQLEVAKFLIGEVVSRVPVFAKLERDMWPRLLPCFNFIEFMPNKSKGSSNSTCVPAAPLGAATTRSLDPWAWGSRTLRRR